MTEKIDVLLLLLGAIGILAVFSSRFRLPFPIVLVGAGLVIGLTPGLPHLALKPDLVLLIFLPPILFSEASLFPWEEFRKHLSTILLLAIGLVLVTTVTVGLTAFWIVPGMSLAAAFVLGAIVSPPDAVAASAVMKNLHVPRRLVRVLQGESLVNDSSGLVAYQFAVAAVVTGAFSLPKAGADFAWMSFGGIALGLAVAYGISRLHRLIDEPAVEVMLSLMSPYLIYLPAERMGVSGVLAVVAGGLFIGSRSARIFVAESRIDSAVIWEFIGFILNGIIFILIGLQFPRILEGLSGFSWYQLTGYAAAVCGVVILTRFLWMLPLPIIASSLFPHAAPKQKIQWGARVVASWSGMRGVVSLAAALAIPHLTATGEAFPTRNLILFLTFAVILVTLVLQGLTLPLLIRFLKVEETEGDFVRENTARAELFELSIRKIDELMEEETNEATQGQLKSLREIYTSRSESLRRELSGGEQSQGANLIQRKLFFYMLAFAREQLMQMHRAGKVTEVIRRRIEHDLDIEESRFRRVVRSD